MAKIHNLGFPRIGANRELKFALEAFWNQQNTKQELLETASLLQQQNLQLHQNLDFAQIGDFSLYDHVLDTSFLFGNVPERFGHSKGDNLENYFQVARGGAQDNCGCNAAAGEMTKWFDTNYHYIVPEFNAKTSFSLHPENLLTQVRLTRSQGFDVKPVIIGPLTYLFLGKSTDKTNPLDLLDSLLPQYANLLDILAKNGVEWVQIDEPALVTELSAEWKIAYKYAYQYLYERKVKLLLTTYFGELADNFDLVCKLPVDGVHIDAIRAKEEVYPLANALNHEQILSVGIIDGRNVWKTDLRAALDFLQPLVQIKDKYLWIAPSCSMIHCPVDLGNETTFDPELNSWLAFAVQKLQELNTLGTAINFSEHKVAKELVENQTCITARSASTRSKNTQVRNAIALIQPDWLERSANYQERIKLQKESLNLPLLPTTTIGSFPQTAEIRQLRTAFKKGDITVNEYQQAIKQQIQYCITQQEILGLDVLVHGEAERNDMVEYFGECLEGIATSKFGWVQSYGSRCVKPPIIYGDVLRDKAITVEWTRYAQTLTKKPVKGMLTGPVTILNWSFVRDDQSRVDTCKQIALAIRDEVLDLEKAGTDIIQIDEAALREGLPLKRSEWQSYLDWAIEGFKISANSVKDTTQIHTHMCYSEFNDIIQAIAQMDADVITIETSRSDMVLLNAFDEFAYPNDIGPGVYDIHSPNIPDEASIISLIESAAKRIPKERLWINPDCGLKTRKWDEVTPALHIMVAAAKSLRQNTAFA